MSDARTGAGSWKNAIAIYTRPRVIAMIFLGFAAGLPFSWIGVTYSIKVFWAPVIDRLPLPVLTRTLGKRRSWMLTAQFTIATGLAGMALTDPHADLTV